MGIGDELMITGEVRRRATPQRFAIWDPRKRVQRWQDIWGGNPRIARVGEPYDEVLSNSGGYRPYIENKTATRWLWRRYGPTAGEIYLTPEEQQWAARGAGAIVIQPMLKPRASPNQQWPRTYWEKLVAQGINRYRFVQVGLNPMECIPGAEFVLTYSFRHACGVLLGARGAVLQEGGLHHAAAALGVPSVVLFGGFISPECTGGYPKQTSLFVRTAEHPLGCGMRIRCHHCEVAMEAFTHHKVLRELERLL